MAKKEVFVDVIIDDKGTVKRLQVSTSKLGGSLDKVTKATKKTNKSTDKFQRNLKGVGAQSSNVTKNFSKMSQGMTGSLVPAYAVLAANIFAVSAAFEFLKRAGTLKTLREGQIAFAAATGIALRSLTIDIIAATDAQVTFEDASQAAAIGVASGLTADQLIRIGKAAKDTSLILGRDVTDSFNRLVRGITKAEPELLDELGIILRLKDATEKYSLILNKNVNDLTAAERTQAVANDTLEQAEQKYGRILSVVEPTTNAFIKMGKAFDDIINSIKLIAASVLGPFAEAITRTPLLGIAVLGLFAKSIITTIIPSMEEWGTTSVESAAFAENAFRDAKIAAESLGVTQDKLISKNQAAARLQGLGGVSFRGKGFQQILSGQGGAVTAQQLVGMKRAVQNSKTMSKSMRLAWTKELDIMLIATKKATTGIGASFELVTTKIQVLTTRMQLHWTKAMAGMRAAVSTLTVAMGRLLSFAGKASIAFLAFEIIRGFLIKDKEIDPFITAIAAATDKMAALTEEFKDFNAVQKIITEDGAGLLTFYKSLGNRIGSLTAAFGKTAFDFGILEFDASGLTKFQKEINRLADVVNPKGTGGANKGFAGPANFGEFLLNSDDKQLNNIGNFLKSLGLELETANKAFGTGGSATINEFLEIITKLSEAGTADEVKRLTKEYELQAVKVDVLTRVMNSLEQQTIDNKASVSSILQQFVPESQAIRTLNLLNKESTDILLVAADAEKFLDDTQKARLKTIEQQVDILGKIDILEKQKVRRDKALELGGVLTGIGSTQGQKALIDFEQQRIALINRRVTAEARIQLIQISDKETNKQKDEAIFLLEQELKLINAQSDALERKANTLLQVFDAANQALESSLKLSITSLITGEESSIRDAMVKIAQSMLSAVAGTLAKQITDRIMGTAPLAVAAAQGAIIASAFMSAGTVVAAQLRAAMFGSVTTGIVSSVGPGGTSFPTTVVKQGFLSVIRGLLPFASGGIARGPERGFPAMLHGTEAVIPLPNGKSVPVDLGDQGQNNNIEINIAIDNNGRSESNSNVQGSAANLGNAIARAVQAELQNQKRSGGILSPFGVA